MNARSISLGTFTAFQMQPGSAIHLPDASTWYPANTFARNPGWIASTEGAKSQLVLSYHPDEPTAEARYVLGSLPTPVLLPERRTNEPKDLRIRAPQWNDAPILFGVMQTIKHDGFYAEAVGQGIEIGPGANPRIRPSEATKVTYLERYSEDEYLKYNPLYKELLERRDDNLFSRYVVGSAHEIPDNLGLMDFIFSGHVFEHLPNPIGHLRLWKSRLKPGGKIMAVIPALRGCYDFMHHLPTEVGEWIELADTSLSAPQPWQYDKYIKRYGRTRLDMVNEDIRPHFSFFTEENLSALLRYACEEIGYSDFSIRTAVNNVSMEFKLLS